MPNRLASELSPYLLQHKDNPVEWYPWGEEAFERARREDKPIFLSVGYSTCHWCHVMEHESFEDPTVAAILSRDFVSIKVDREERPDVDRVYMAFVQATTGSGGWPMSVWLTPALEPFYGGTYFPPTGRWGRPGFVEVLDEIARVWREERDKVEESASRILDRLRSLHARASSGQIPEPTVLDRAVGEFAASFDARRGGFGGAPKFPRPSELLFLLREHARTGLSEPRDMAVVTLRAMALGGVHDHLGGGFHRYSVDGEWRVPHFEKMLYDQAQLVLAYAEAAQLSGDPFLAEVALDTLGYVRRELTHSDGGFFSAEDADSVPPERAGDDSFHKMEGAFYIWRDQEIAELIGDDADIVRLHFGIQPDGNAPSDPQGEFTHKNLLYVARPVEEVASMTGRDVADVRQVVRRARETLLASRARRPRPHLDDKVLTAWNGLMIAACARAARTLEDGAGHLQDAQRAASFLRSRVWDGSALSRRYRDGDTTKQGYAEDYACLIFGLLELFQADGDLTWLRWAGELQERQDALFWDGSDGGWFSTTGEDPSVLVRLREDYDGAEPAASSIGVMNLLVLSHLIGDVASGKGASRGDRIEATLRSFGTTLAQSARAVPMMLAALSTYHSGLTQVVIVGDASDEHTRRLHRSLRRHYRPSTVVVPVTPANQMELSADMPWMASMRRMSGRATAYVCRDFTCDAPVTDPDALESALGGG